MTIDFAIGERIQEPGEAKARVQKPQKLFAANLKRLLDLRYPGLSLRRRAALLNLSPSYLSEILRGLVIPPPETVCRIAAALGVVPEVFTSEESTAPIDPFDFSFRTAAAWRWRLSVVERRLPDATWRARFADAVVLFFFTAETYTVFSDLDEVRIALAKVREKIVKCEDFRCFKEILFDLFAFCGTHEPNSEKKLFEEPEGESARKARTLVFHAFLFTEDFLSYLASPSPLKFVHDVQRLAWVNHLALKEILRFINRCDRKKTGVCDDPGELGEQGC